MEPEATPPGNKEGLPQAPSGPSRALLHALAVSMLILTGTVFVFIYRQIVLVRRQTTELARYAVEYERSNGPAFIEEMRRKFGEYRKQDSNFNAIYVRYFGTNEPPVRPPRVSSAPAPGTNPGAKSP